MLNIANLYNLAAVWYDSCQWKRAGIEPATCATSDAALPLSYRFIFLAGVDPARPGRPV